MSGALTISNTLRSDGTAGAQRVKQAVARYAAALTREREQTDLAFHHIAFAELILATEECEDAFAQLSKEQHAALALSMQASGNAQFHLGAAYGLPDRARTAALHCRQRVAAGRYVERAEAQAGLEQDQVGDEDG